MKCLCFLLSGFTIALAIQVPSSWHEEDRNGLHSRYKDMQILRTNKNSNKLQVINSPELVHRKSKVQQRHRKLSWPKYKKKAYNKSTPYKRKLHEQRDPSVLRSIKPKIKPESNVVQSIAVNSHFPETKNTPNFTHIVPSIDAYQISPIRTQPVLPFSSSRSIHLSSTQPNYSSEQETLKQNQLFDFISTPLDFREFDQSSRLLPPKFQQEKPISRESSPHLVPYQNVGGVFTVPSNHKIQDETTEQKQQTTKGPISSFQNFDQTFNIPFNHEFVSSNNKYNVNPANHLFKNYRDDRSHEPIAFDPFLDNKPLPTIERDESEKAPVSSHEYPADIPTKPVYPGEGLWAKRGLSHKPFVSKQKYETLEKDTHIPDGYDTFIGGEKIFNQQQQKFHENADALTKKYNKVVSPKDKQQQPDPNVAQVEVELLQNEETAKVKNTEDDAHNQDFVPMKLYAQVRHSEDVHHLPTHEDENGRLREAIKESKIQTVYTEEGYEDNAYDHEGHEKEAENKEEFEELDRGQEKIKEEKVPHEKYNLHLLPRIESTRYSSGLKLPTDEEIENHKKTQLGLGEDADIGGSQYIESENSNDDSHTANTSQDENPKFDSPAMKKSNNFISTKEIKTMTTKENDDGDTETEISSKIKVIMQPNNTAESHEFVKINPKVYKNWKKVPSAPDSHESIAKIPTRKMAEPNTHGIYIEEVITTSTEQLLTTVATTEFPEIMSEEIPITTLATTAMPSSDLFETSKNINEAFSRIDVRSRKKRFVNDFADIKVNNDFISEIKHDLVKPQEDNKKAKYPYYTIYKQINLNENSPLRYSEDLNNIPVKTKMKMAFYDQADSRIECPEIESTVEPIPERIQNAGQEYESDENDDDSNDGETKNEGIEKTETPPEQPKGPRLNMLGDKIDCLKARYFGENPLDSPFFDEDTVGPVKPIFKSSGDSTSENGNGKFDSDNISAETQNPPSSVNYEDNEIIDDINEEKQVELDEMYPNSDAINVTNKGTTSMNVFNDSANSSLPNEVENDVSYRISTTPTVGVEDKKIVPDTQMKSFEEFDEEKLGLNVFSDISRNMKYFNISENRNITQIPSSKQNVPTLSLLTTPGYTIDLKPRHIYDQIHLLKYLPEEQIITNNASGSTVEHVVPGIEIKLSNNSETDSSENDVRQKKSHEAEEEDKLTYSSSMIQVLPSAEALKKRRKFRIRRKRPGFQIFDINGFIPTPYTIRKGHPYSSSGESKRLEIFDINKFLPTPYPIIANHVTSSTVLPKYKVLSEVFYKDNINTNEQLNVFTDVLNNIRNSSAVLTEDSSQEPSHINIASNTLNDNGRGSDTNNYNQDTYLNVHNKDQEFINHHPSIGITVPTPTYTAGPNKGNIRFINDINSNKPGTANSQSKSDDEKLKHYVALLEARMRQSSNLQNKSPVQLSTTRPKGDEYFEKVEGMNPPGIQHYKTIYNPKRDDAGYLSIPGYVGMNKYLVIGMKPPPRQKVLIYSDFSLNNNQLRKKIGLLRRSKRSTNRAAYAEVSRNLTRTLEDDKKTTKEDEDDYVPHRPKNYYYDEKTGKIVYTNTNEPLKEEEEFEVEYIEITETPQPKTTSKPKQNPIFATATPPPDGQSYVDFVKKLKSAADYKYIPDPTTTERNTEQSTEKITTLSSISTTPPEFLSILDKVRKTSNYKIIDDPTENKPTTTEASEEAAEEEYEEETIPTNVRNSPGGEQHNMKNNLQIFDISDYIPKLKNYLPSTSIDYSKYKTISRPAPKHNQETEEDHQENEPPSAVQAPDESSSSSEMDKNGESLEEDEMSVESISSVPFITTTTTAPIKMHATPSSRRRRPTTLRSTRTTTTSIPMVPSTLATAESQEVRNEKPRRNYRRRPTRIKSTTERFLNEDSEDTTKILRRRKIDENKDSKLTRNGNDRQIITLDKRNETLVGKILNPGSIQPKKRVEVVQNYNRHIKHGGNYRREDENEQKQKLAEPMSGVTRKSKDVEIISEFDKTKRHGGNYKSEDVNDDESKATTDIPDQIEDIEPQTLDSSYTKDVDEPLIVQLLPKYDNEETRNQHSSEDQDTKNPIKRKRVIRKHKKNPENVKPIGRLTDVVLKPESFYSDPDLPQTVNLLVLAQPLSNEEAVENVEIEDGTSTETMEFTEVHSTATTKRPNFIKDPGERLYYYAPV